MRRDVAHAIRVLWKSPRFTAAALVVLALGIGANSAMFSLVYSVLLSPLPYREPARIAVILGTAEHRDMPFSLPPAVFLDFRARTYSFGPMAAAELWSPSLTGTGEAEELHGLRTTAAIFDVFGVPAMQGRTFLPEDEKPGSPKVVVIAASLWRRRFGGETSVIGGKITLNREPCTVIGVLPDNFYFPPFWGRDTEIYTPIPATPAWAQDRVISTLRIFARLKPGVDWEQARGDVRGVAAQLAGEYVQQAKTSAVATPVLEMSVGSVRTSLVILFGAVACTLLIACANLANLFLARGTGRQKEAAIRQALGASRVALVRHMLAESLVVSFAGGLLGLFAAWAALHAFVAGLPEVGNFHMPRASEIAIGPAAVGFHLLVCTVAGLLFGLAPAMRASRVDLNTALKDAGRGSTGAGGRGFRGVLIASEVALALMLLAGAGLLMQSFRKLRDLNPGFDPRGMVAVNVAVSGSDHARGDRRAQFYRDAVERFRALPGVTAASAVNHVPLAGDVFRMEVEIEGRPAPRPGEAPSAVYRTALPDYFHTAGIRVVRGRAFDDRDTENTTRVVVINQTMARTEWPNADAMGKRFRMSTTGGPTAWFEVVGIVQDVKQHRWAAGADNEMYLPFLQDPAYQHSSFGYLTMTLVLRTGAPAESIAAGIREQVRAIDRNVPVTSIVPMQQVVDDTVWLPRLEMSVLAAMAGLALVLATVGIYAVVSYVVSGRTQEIGIRMALGADAGAVARLVMAQSLGPVAIGAVAGLAGTVVLARWMRTLLFEVDAADPATLAMVTALLVAVAIAAALAPARRASRVDPVSALRG
jgi:putative ABC transport system permease protein